MCGKLSGHGKGVTEICVFFTSASALVIYVSKLPLGACSIRLNDLIHTAGEGLTLQLFSVFMSRVLLEYAYFLSFICFQWITYGSPMYKSLTKTKILRA